MLCWYNLVFLVLLALKLKLKLYYKCSSSMRLKQFQWEFFSSASSVSSLSLSLAYWMAQTLFLVLFSCLMIYNCIYVILQLQTIKTYKTIALQTFSLSKFSIYTTQKRRDSSNAFKCSRVIFPKSHTNHSHRSLVRWTIHSLPLIKGLFTICHVVISPKM